MLVWHGELVINLDNVVSFSLDTTKSRILFSLLRTENPEIVLSFYSDEQAETAFKKILKAHQEQKPLLILKQ